MIIKKYDLKGLTVIIALLLLIVISDLQLMFL